MRAFVLLTQLLLYHTTVQSSSKFPQLPFQPLRALNHVDLPIEHDRPPVSFPRAYSPAYPLGSKSEYSVLLNSSTGTFADLGGSARDDVAAPPDFSANVNVSLTILCTDRHNDSQDLFVNINHAHYVTKSTTSSGGNDVQNDTIPSISDHAV